jgi:hypothetical protein
VVVPRLVDTARVRSLIAGVAGQALGRPVRFGSVSVTVLPRPAVVVRDVEVGEDPAFGPAPFARLPEARVRLRLWPLLLLRAELGDVVAERPVISVVRDAQGRWNVASLGVPAEPRAGGRTRGGTGGGAPAGAVLLSRVRIDDGAITFETRAGRAPIRYRVEGLDVTLTAGAGAPAAFRGDARVQPGDLAIAIDGGTLALGAGRGLLDSPVGGRVRVQTDQLRPLVAASLGPEPSVAGVLRGAFAMGGTVGRPRATGEVELTDVTIARTSPRCPEPRTRRLALGPVKASAALDHRRVTARPVTTSLGAGTITASLATALSAAPRIEVTDLAVTGVPVEKVLVDFLCQAHAVTGPLELTGRASALAADPLGTLEGAGRVRVGPGRVVGAQAVALLDGVLRLGGAVTSALRGGAPTPGPVPLDYDSIAGTWTVTDGVLTTRDLVFTSPALRIAAAGTYGLASGRLDFDTVVDHGGGQVRARVTGTASAPAIRLVSAGGGRGLDPGAVQRGFEDLLRRFR